MASSVVVVGEGLRWSPWGPVQEWWRVQRGRPTSVGMSREGSLRWNWDSSEEILMGVKVSGGWAWIRTALVSFG